MSLPLVLFLVAVVTPVFFGRARSAPVWLGMQAMCLAWSALAQHGAISSHALAAALELLAVRAWLVPVLVHRMIGRRTEPNVELMPSNLFAWAIAAVMIVLAFEVIGKASADTGAFALAVMASTVVSALFILATNDSPTSQLVAVLFMENAIVLFESLLPEPWPLPVHIALTTIYVLTVVVGTRLVGKPASAKTEDKSELREVL